VPWGLGTDQSGSIRIPSAYNGIVGYRPTVNRWPCDFGIKVSHYKDTCGPMTLDMEDLSLVDSVVTETIHKEVPTPK
jgi:indoleacetamide hydrolase